MCRTGTNIRYRKDGRWEARFIKSRNENGKADYSSVYGHTYKEALKKQKEGVAALNSTAVALVKGTFRQLSEQFLLTREISLSESSAAIYQSILKNHLLPAFGGRLVNEITAAMVEKYIADKRCSGRLDKRGGLSAGSIISQITLFKQILHFGMRKGWNSHPDIFSADMPKAKKKVVKTISEEDWRKLNNFVKNDPQPKNLGILLGMNMGLRIGEVCGLRYSDIDFERGALNVGKTLERISIKGKDQSENKTKLKLGLPKTDSSQRNLPVPGELLQILKTQRLMASGDDAFLISGSERMIEPRVYSRQYKRILQHCGIEYYNFHKLRHTFASRCISVGFDPKTLSAILGHSCVRITLDYYVHPTMQDKKNLIEKLLL